jgi:adenylate kinase
VKRRVVLLGPPASGKGTQAELIRVRYKIPTTSTGAILRQEARAGTALGREAEKIISGGRLAPDEFVLGLVESWLRGQSGSFLLDGFPRTVKQAEAFDELLASRGEPVELAIFLDVTPETIAHRMARRLTCSRCGKIVSVGRHVSSVKEPCPNCGGPLEIRSDDNPQSLKVRLEEFRQKSLPVTGFYRDRQVLAEIPADDDVEAVFNKIAQRIEE